MSQIAFPPVDAGILDRRDAILKGLAFLPGECLIVDAIERRAFETDALTAYRRLPLAVVLPRSTEEVARSAEISAREAASTSCRAAPARRCRAAPFRRKTRSSSASPR